MSKKSAVNCTVGLCVNYVRGMIYFLNIFKLGDNIDNDHE